MCTFHFTKTNKCSKMFLHSLARNKWSSIQYYWLKLNILSLGQFRRNTTAHSIERHLLFRQTGYAKSESRRTLDSPSGFDQLYLTPNFIFNEFRGTINQSQTFLGGGGLICQTTNPYIPRHQWSWVGGERNQFLFKFLGWVGKRSKMHCQLPPPLLMLSA